MPSKAPSAFSSCSMAGRSRWLVGSSSTRQFAPAAISCARLARVRSPGESVSAAGARPRRSRARTWPAASGPPAAGSPLRATNASSSEARAVEAGARLVELPTAHARAEPARARRERQPAEQRLDERGLAAAVGPDDRDALAPRELEVDRPERERAAPHHAPRSSRATTSPERSPPPKRSCSSQRPHGLSTTSRRSMRLLGGADLGGLLLRALACARGGCSCRARRSVLAVAHAGLGPLALAARPVGQPVALGRVGLVALLGVAGGRRAQLEVAGPAAAVLRRRCGRSRRARARA